jgi:hypothetical protein
LAPPARIESVVVNQSSDADYQQQRSLVTNIALTFSSKVTVQPEAFELVRLSDDGRVGVDFTTSLDATGTKSVVRLSFYDLDPSDALAIVNGSLADGRYQLVVHGDRIRDTLDRAIDGDGTAGGDLVYGDEAHEAFFRLFGDADGDGQVDLLRAAGNDVDRFLRSMLRRAGDPGYVGFFDFNGDGIVNTLDYLELNKRRGKAV